MIYKLVNGEFIKKNIEDIKMPYTSLQEINEAIGEWDEKSFMVKTYYLKIINYNDLLPRMENYMYKKINVAILLISIFLVFIFIKASVLYSYLVLVILFLNFWSWIKVFLLPKYELFWRP